jgi:hypothetical protein
MFLAHPLEYRLQDLLLHTPTSRIQENKVIKPDAKALGLFLFINVS